MGPYLVFLASTVNGYEGTGRSLSLKLISDLRKRQAQTLAETAGGAASEVARLSKGRMKVEKRVHEKCWRAAATEATEVLEAKYGEPDSDTRSLREIKLYTPIRYASGDAVESWLSELLCLDDKHQHANANRLVCGTPSPRDCDL